MVLSRRLRAAAIIITSSKSNALSYERKRLLDRPPTTHLSKTQLPFRSGTSLSSYPFLLSRGGAIPSTPGLGSALLSPLASAIGFMFWDKNWHGSAFALNLFKNAIVSVYFFAAISVTKTVFNPFSQTTPLPALTLSAFLGVVAGDCTAIASLRRLGSRRYLLIDCLKPAFSTTVGAVAFGERVTRYSVSGILAVIAGVYAASIQSVGGEEGDHPLGDGPASIAIGYWLAAAHLVLDTAGAAITKRACRGTAMGPLDIGLLRFGSAALMLAGIGAAGKLSDRGRGGRTVTPWYSLPRTVDSERTATFGEMTRENWRAIIVGTFFVTFLAPTLFLRSLLLMPLGIAVTLSCLAPLYEPVLAKVLRGVEINLTGVFGTILALIGVAILSIRTS